MILAALLLLTACETRPVSEDTAYRQEEPPAEGAAEVLTDVFAPAELVLPEGYRLYSVAETKQDSVTLLLRKNEKDPETGERILYTRLYTAYTDGRDPDTGEPLAADCRAYTSWGGKTFWLMADPETANVYYLSEQVNGAETRVFADLQAYAAEGMFFMPEQMLADGEGNLYIAGGGQILVVKADFSACLTFGSREQALHSISRDSTGKIWTSYTTVQEETYIAALHPDSGRLEEEQRLGTAADIQRPVMSASDERYTFFYPGYEGIYGRTADTGTDELLLHYANSGLHSLNDTITPLNGDVMLVESAGGSGNTVFLYTRQPDIVYTTQDVIYLYMNGSASSVENAVIRFNREHPDKRIIVKDYGQGEDREAGAQKMVMDMEAGLASPDIVMGDVSEAGIRYMVENGHFLDLYSFLDTDPVLTRENILGIVQKCFSCSGKMFGLPGEITVQTMLTGRETAGDKTSWTVEDVLALAENLPEGSVYRTEMTRDMGFVNFLSRYGYHNFIDMEQNTASFDSDTFRRVLTYIQRLPEDRVQVDSAAEIAMYREGTAAVRPVSYTMGLTDFLTEDLYFPDGAVRIGFPATGENGGTWISTTGMMLIADTCENPELAWEFVRDYVLTFPERRSDPIISPVKSIFWEEIRMHIQENTLFRMINGRVVPVTGDLEPDGTYNGSPGEIVTIKDEQAEEMIAWLDSVGTPVYDVLVPAEITAIVDEEISAFLAGTGTADSCAGAIQSRVEIWLAERQ